MWSSAITRFRTSIPPTPLPPSRARELDCPFIIVSGTIGEDAAVEAMRAGAHDYVLKNNLARLAPAIDRESRATRTRVVRRAKEREARKAVERQLQQSQKDGSGWTTRGRNCA